MRPLISSIDAEYRRYEVVGIYARLARVPLALLNDRIVRTGARLQEATAE